MASREKIKKLECQNYQMELFKYPINFESDSLTGRIVPQIWVEPCLESESLPERTSSQLSRF